MICTRGSTATLPIIVPTAAGPSFKYAAQELQHYVQKMTDVELSIGNKGERGIFLESGKEQLGDDGFNLRVDDDGIHISGGKRGILYGVYELLEEYGGCGWYSSWQTIVPRQERFTVPRNLNRTEKPIFLLREPSWVDVRRHPDFAVRLRMNGAGSNPQDRHGGAAYRFVKNLPRSHTFDRILPAKRYFKDHPEWFSEIGGVRRGNGDNTQICLTNPQALEEATKNVLNMIATDPHSARVIGISQNDCREYCRCAACAMVDAEEGSHAGTLIRFVNAMAERVARVYPDIVVETLIYQYTRKPPKLTRPAKNVMPCFCTYEAEFAHPLWESLYIENRNMIPDLDGWNELTDNLFLWDYTSNWRNFLQPMATAYTLQPNFQYYRDHGVKYLYAEGGGYHADFAELRAWLIAKLSWNPGVNQEKLLKRFFKGYYGAAAPHATAVFQRFHDLYRAQPEKVQTIWHRDQPEVLTDAYLEWALDQWAQAEQLVASDPILRYNVRTSSLSTLATCLNRFAGRAKIVWATKYPERYNIPEKASGLYNKAIAIMDEAKAHGHPIRTGDGNRTERTLNSWKRIFEVKPPKKGEARGVAGVNELVRIGSAVLKDDVGAISGKAYVLPTTSQGTPLFLSIGNVALDDGCTYRIRVHARIERAQGGTGEGLRVRVFHNTTGDCPIEFSLNVVDAVKGWAWYDAGTFCPQDNHEITIGGGRFDCGGGARAVKELAVDALEFTRVQ